MSTERTRKAAVGYLQRGLAIIPVPAGKKKPDLSDWQRLRLTEDDVPDYWTNGQNIGVLTGEPSGERVDVDLDVLEAVTIAGEFLPSTLTGGREGNQHSHWWFIAPHAKSETFKDVDGSVLLEIRANGRQTLVPPSVHPTGEEYVWHITDAPVEVTAESSRHGAVILPPPRSSLAMFLPRVVGTASL